jgi:hypothetical protein
MKENFGLEIHLCPPVHHDHVVTFSEFALKFFPLVFSWSINGPFARNFSVRVSRRSRVLRQQWTCNLLATLKSFFFLESFCWGGLWHQLYEKLKMNVASAAFLEKLKSFSLNGDGMTSSDSILVKTEGEKFLPDSFLNWLQIPYEWMTSRVSEDWFRTLFSSDCKFRSIEDPSRVVEFFFSWTLFQVIANSIRKWRPLESKFPNSFSCDLHILRRLWKWLLLCFGYVLKSCQWNSPYL